MIQNTDAIFPNNAVLLIQDRFQQIDPDMLVLKRPVRIDDPVQCIAVYGTTWVPEESSVEFGSPIIGRYAHEPSLAKYNIQVQGLVKDMDVENGLAVQSVMAKMIRAVLYHDEPLRVGLTSLVDTRYGVSERLRRWGIRQQRFMSNEIEGDWNFLSSLDLWIETETTV